MKPYPAGISTTGAHTWGIETDFKARRIHQKCTCGWKCCVREFDGALSLYDNANRWASHFDSSKWWER